jgi:hypothetical protein
MKQFIKEFAFAKRCDGILYYDVKENFFVCIGYPLPIVPDRLEFVKSFKINP